MASKVQAEAGEANNVYMTPLRVKEAIDKLAGGGIKSIQRGTLTGNDDETRSVAISPVNPAKSVVIIDGTWVVGRFGPYDFYEGSSPWTGDSASTPYLSAFTSTQLTFAGASLSGDQLGRYNGVFSWQVIEYM